MNRKIVFTFIAIYGLAAGIGYFFTGSSEEEAAPDYVASYILQGTTTEAVVDAVESVDGEITHEFAIINAVAATLTIEQRDALLVNPVIIAINEDAPISALVIERDGPNVPELL